MSGQSRLLERRFRARVPLEAAWAHLERVESWPSWARHISRVTLEPAGRLQSASRGTIHLRFGPPATFVMEELHPGSSWRWVGPLLWLRVHYDHQFVPLGPDETEIRFVVDAEGFAAGSLGRLFAAIYKLNLDRAIPHLIRELEAGRSESRRP